MCKHPTNDTRLPETGDFLPGHLFDDPRYALIWLVLRLILGTVWLAASLAKLRDPSWISTGQAFRDLLGMALNSSDPAKTVPVVEWHHTVIQQMLASGSYVWIVKAVALAELLLAISLLAGALVGPAALLAVFLSLNYLMLGTTNMNIIMLIAAIFLLAAWKTAGSFGVDHFLLRWLGVTQGRTHLPSGSP